MFTDLYSRNEHVSNFQCSIRFAHHATKSQENSLMTQENV